VLPRITLTFIFMPRCYLNSYLFYTHCSCDLPSCAGRCGEGYSRDATCNCDYNCQHYMECCPDFKKVCTMELSCKGRCFESFARGRECDCDSECKKYGKCCPDYENFCGRDETNLCNGKPVDALTTLHNGTLVAFRGHYFWMLSAFNPPSPPRKITEVWGIPSPIDTAFTRCNCEGKTFFFKDSQYWRFTNDIKDPGYPKQIAKGFGGLNGKIVAALSIAKYEDRPESVYFFKRGGSIQQYIYKQEPIKKCPGRRPAISYSVYGETTQVRRRRFERAIGPSQTHTIRIHYSPVRVSYQDKGFLHNEVKMSLQWRGFPNVVTSAIALPNIRKPDGYDYYAFSRNQYYNIDEPSRTARVVTTRFGRSLSNVWYKCP
uniref:Proteoglycan 4 n=1 Tax=Ailuropoda melanoleuca TaxID=9646 RepID=A0A7N5JQ45_AILME